MKQVLDWVKLMPFALIGAVLALVSFVLVGMAGSARTSHQDLAKSRSNKIAQLQQIGKENVTIPPENIDDPPRQISGLVINRPAIAKMEEIYAQMSGANDELDSLVIDQNQLGHYPMLEGIFPVPEAGALLFETGKKYREAFEEMLDSYSPNALYPRLNAGAPPSSQDVSEEVELVRRRFLNAAFVESEAGLNAQQRAELTQEMAAAKLNFLKRYAESIHVYVPSTNIDGGRGDYPFTVMPWSTSLDRPKLADVWRGQMQLWIQQDIVEAIGRANHVDERAFNVMVAPIKELTKIEVGTGPVGITSVGMAGGTIQIPGPPNREPSQRVFSLSPSGRTSNSLYDVWHADVRMVVDIQRFAEIVDAFSSVNFMAIVGMDVIDIDEYDGLSRGKVYGLGDVVEVRLVIETIWFRQWTTQLMPPQIQVEMGLMTAEEAGITVDGALPVGGGGGFSPEQFGQQQGPEGRFGP